MVIGSLFLSTCGSSLSATARCAQIWNDDVPADLSGRFTQAIVYPWTDKAGDDGCGVVFVSAPQREWVMFAGVITNDRVEGWSREAGDRWREDSPEGSPTHPNVVVFPGGLVSAPS
jgi:hypothetical protein